MSWIPPEIIHYTYDGGGTPVSDIPANATTTTDSHKTIEHGKVQLIVSEGPIYGPSNGLKSIKLQGTPIQNSDNSFNFKDVSVAFVRGTNTQVPIKGFDGVESETAVNAQVFNGTPIVRTISNTTATDARIKISCPYLQTINQTSGATSGAQINFTIHVQPNGGSYQQVTLDDGGGFKNEYTSKFIKGYRFDLPGTGPWNIMVARVTADSSSQYLKNDLYFESYSTIVDGKFRDPYTAKLAVACNADQFSRIPLVTALMKGRIISVPSNYNATTRGYTGIWDGTFIQAYTDNPAWIFYDMVVNDRYGCGEQIDIAQIDKWALYSIAQVCDALVNDGQGGTEPRFRCNVYIQDRQDAIKLLNYLASVFRGCAYWAEGTIQAVQDVDDPTPFALFTASNVVDGKFVYTSTAKAARHTAAIITWNDPNNGYKQTPMLVQDDDGVARYGYNPLEVAAYGCTSPGQAKRHGLMAISTELSQPETVTFKTAALGTKLRPFKIVTIQDAFRFGKRFGGRIVSATTTQVTLDAPVELEVGKTYQISCTLPSGSVEVKNVTTGAGTISVLAVSSAFSAAPQTMGQWILAANDLVPLKYRVLTISEDDGVFSITALLHAPGKYAAVESGLVLDVPPAATANVFPAPVGVTCTEKLAIQGDRLVSDLAVGWTASSGASSYAAIASRDNGPWQNMVVSGTSAVLKNVQPGVYTARVVAIWPKGRSTYGESSPYTLLGKTAAPADVTGLVVAVGDATVDIKWTANTDLDLSLYEVRYGASWAAGTLIAKTKATRIQWPIPATGSYTIRVKAQDTTGNLSANDANYAISIGLSGVGILNSDDILSRAKKPELLIRYNTELQTKTDLDAKATTLSVSHTAYDNAVTAVTTFLQNLGGSSPNWDYLNMATDTSLGTGGGASLRTLWGTVASTRSALQTAIAAAYPAYQIASSATDAMQKSVFTTANKIRGDLMVDGSLFAKSLVVANCDNLVPNPTTSVTTGPSGAIELAGVIAAISGAAFANNGYLRQVIMNANGSESVLVLTEDIPCSPGDSFYAECKAGFTYDSFGSVSLVIEYRDGNGTNLGDHFSAGLPARTFYNADTPSNKLSISAVAPAGTQSLLLYVYVHSGNYAQYIYLNNFYLRRCNDANLLVDGILTALMARAETMESLSYAAGTSSTAPVGFKLSGGAFTTTYLDGTTDANCHMEMEGNGNFGGYKVATINDKIFNNSVTLTGSGNWTAPPCVTRVEVLAVGPGGNGAKHASGGGGGGGGGSCITTQTVVPGTAYAYVVGTGGSGVGTTFAAGTIKANAGMSATGAAGGQGNNSIVDYGTTKQKLSGGTTSAGTSGAIAHSIDAPNMFSGGGGGSSSGYGGGCGAYSLGGAPGGTAGGGGASGMGPGGNGSASGTAVTPTGYGGGGGGTTTGTAGTGAPGTIILRW